MKITTKIDWKRNIVSITAIIILTLLTTANAVPACQGTPVTACNNTSQIPADQPCANYYVSGSFCGGRMSLVYDGEGNIIGRACDGTGYHGIKCSGTKGNCTGGGGYCN